MDHFSDMFPSASDRSESAERGAISEEECRQLLSRTEAMLHEAYMHAFSLFRHDWMNDIQLLVGYARLKKYDKLIKFTEMIKEKAAGESALFKLGIPRLTLFLYTFKTDANSMRLHLRIEPELRLDQRLDRPEETAETVVRLVGHFSSSARGGNDGELHLQMFVEEGCLAILFRYEGEYERADLERKLEQEMALHGRNAGWNWETDFHGRTANVGVRVLLRGRAGER